MQSIMYGDMKVFGGRAHPALVQEICAYLGTESGKVVTYNFSDGETVCQIDDIGAPFERAHRMMSAGGF